MPLDMLITGRIATFAGDASTRMRFPSVASLRAAPSDSAVQRRRWAIDDLTTEWIAADRRPLRAETAFRCGIS